MKRAIVFANGRLEKPPRLVALLQKPVLIIAADGGARNCQSLGIQPQVIIGDFDSIDAYEETYYRSAGVNLIRHPARKDETDLELALRYAVQQAADEVVVLGALGDRWDMTFANVLLAAHPAFALQNIRFLDGTQELVVLYPEAKAVLSGIPGDSLSLVPLSGDARGINTLGLEYPLVDETLQFGSPRGVSNVFIREKAEISFTQGLLLCVINNKSR